MSSDAAGDRFDPVRWRFIEALARRAAAQPDDVRRLLDDKVAALRAAYAEDAERHRGADELAAPASQDPPPPRGTLAELVEQLARQAPSPGPAPELKTLRYFRSTWSRLSTERRLTQSLAKLPDNAGPLNSHHLMHRSLTLMRDLSPEYLDRFMTYVDALFWVDQVNERDALPVALAARGRAAGSSRRP